MGRYRSQPIKHERQTLNEEARGYLGPGSPEAQVFAAVPPEGISIPDLKQVLYACMLARSHLCVTVIVLACTNRR